MSIDAAIPACGEDERRAIILAHPTLNGIDFVEYRHFPLAAPGRRHVLETIFLKPPPSLGAADLVIEGGARVIGIGVVGTEALGPNGLRVFVTEAGDFSLYRLVVREPATHGIDAVLASAAINFKAGCPTDLDCRVVMRCEEPEGEVPSLDHMARDFESFRTMLLDLARARNPRWTETHPAEPASVLVELLAAEGDRLAWMQDAAGTEASLETCRMRISARRHARLVDYRMHDGRNGFAFVQLDVDGAGTVPAGTQMMTRITAPLRGEASSPGPLIPDTITLDHDGDPALAGVTVFEATARVPCHPDLNRVWLHDFGGRACCLPRGATSAFVYTVQDDGTILRPPLVAGDWLLLWEAKGPETGAAPDADPARRVAVRLTEVIDAEDPAFTATADATPAGPVPRRATAAGDPPMPLMRVTWQAEHAPGFALTITGRDDTGAAVPHAGQARGNVVPVDHGRSIVARSADGTLPPAVTRGRTTALALPAAPLTMQAMGSDAVFAADGRAVASRHELAVPAAEAMPAVVLIVDTPAEEPAIWRAVPDLLASDAFDTHFVTEVDDQGRAVLRFGDDAFGRRLPAEASILARFRIGNGLAGNVGAGSLVHVAQPAAADMTDPADPDAPPPTFPGVTAVWQPVAARAGEEAEALAAVRGNAPSAMHAVQFRAVTEADWEKAALTLAGVAAARAALRWTGSWYTVFVAIHPSDAAMLVALPGGGVMLEPGFAGAMRAALNRWRLAGRDLAVRAGQYVPIRLRIGLCIAPGHFRSSVVPAVREALVGAGGIFDIRTARFGATVHLSRIIATVAGIPGVSSCVVREFHRYWGLPAGEREAGFMRFGLWELPRLDADASLPENGLLVLEIEGEG
ncbi:baseplate J/gp47 family protein [Elioraea rosea]|uniref:hypothetical protein n=1 Tax=Elioraea rosea TaxID=2492390 RepID=UPI0011821A56|nr:hypothetical protein [Elioraea rosea]